MLTWAYGREVEEIGSLGVCRVQGIPGEETKRVSRVGENTAPQGSAPPCPRGTGIFVLCVAERELAA